MIDPSVIGGLEDAMTSNNKIIEITAMVNDRKRYELPKGQLGPAANAVTAGTNRFEQTSGERSRILRAA